LRYRPDGALELIRGDTGTVQLACELRDEGGF